MTPKRLVLPILFVLALGAFLTKDQWRVHETIVAPAPEKAYFRSEWGMSPEEAVSANGVPLKEKPAGQHFYEAEPGEESRYKVLEAPCRFLARDSVVSYTFRDGRLVSYHVFTSDTEGEILDADMRRYLKRLFGSNAEDLGGEKALKLVWQTKNKIANYWFYEELNSLTRPYRAGFGVQNRGPLKRRS